MGAILNAFEQAWRHLVAVALAVLQHRPVHLEAVEIGPERGHVGERGFISLDGWIITAADEVITRQADHSILNGVTRVGLIDLLAQAGLRLVERPFTVAEAKAAREAFLTSTTNFVLPVVRIDDAPVGEGRPGPVVARLRETYLSYTAEQGIGR